MNTHQSPFRSAGTSAASTDNMVIRAPTSSAAISTNNQEKLESAGTRVALEKNNEISGSAKRIAANAPTPEIEPLVSAKELLQLLWSEESRPSLRWLRDQQKRRALPFIKVGARVWFKPSEVLRHLDLPEAIRRRSIRRSR